MDTILEIVKYTIPSLVVFVTAYLLVKTLIDNEQLRRKHESNQSNQKMTTPLRLKAYERLILYLERISPQSILPRTLKPNMTATQLQRELLQTIRMEYEHNLSQQLYVSSKCWQAVITAKENSTKLINMVAARVNAEGKKTGNEFAQILLEAVMDMNQSPNSTAIEIIKAEAKELFG